MDVITTGNHVWDQRNILEYLDREPRILRPINYPKNTPGNGAVYFKQPMAAYPSCKRNAQIIYGPIR